MINNITTLFYTQHEVDFFLYQVGRYGLDADEVSILALRRYEAGDGKPLISGPGVRYFGLQTPQNFSISGLGLVVYGDQLISDLSTGAMQDIIDVFSSMGVPEAGENEYLSGILQGGILVSIRTSNVIQEEWVYGLLKPASISNMVVFHCPPRRVAGGYSRF